MKAAYAGPIVGLLVGVAATFGATSAFATDQSGVTSTLLASQVHFGDILINSRTDPANTWQVMMRTLGESDGYVVDNVLAHNGGTTGWHSHPGPSLIFVIRGSVTNYSSDDPACAGTVYTAGTGFVDPGGSDVHELVNNGNVDAETIALQLLPHGAKRRIDAGVPANCQH
jgi:quercetin dioxygenase-like cupin family protein